MSDLFANTVHSIRQLTGDEAAAKGCYRFLQNERVSEDDIIANMSANCRAAAQGRYVVCIQDTTQVNLAAHRGRIAHDGDYIGATNNKDTGAPGFMIHPCLVVDAQAATPYG